MSFIESENKRHPLSDLDGRSVENYQIQLVLKPLSHRKGWTHFSLFLKDRQERVTLQRRTSGGWMRKPVLEGIHSRGGKGVKGWIEVGDYFPVVYFKGREIQGKPVDLSIEKLDQQLFQFLSEKVPPGGHLMFAYEVSYESLLHRETQLALAKGIPPISTAQGELLFRAGFRLVKDWYLAEGGHEGPRKLWGEKPSNASEAREFDIRTFFQLIGFLMQTTDPVCNDLEQAARKRSLELLRELDLASDLSSFKNAFILTYKQGMDTMDIKKAVYLSCDRLKQILKAHRGKDPRITRRLTELLKVCSENRG